MPKIVLLDTLNSPHTEGSLFNFNGVVHVIKKIGVENVMNNPAFTSALIEPVEVKSFKSSEVIIVIDVPE